MILLSILFSTLNIICPFYLGKVILVDMLKFHSQPCKIEKNIFKICLIAVRKNFTDKTSIEEGETHRCGEFNWFFVDILHENTS